MQIGTLVKIKKTCIYTPELENKLAIVINNGTWSADVRIIDSNRRLLARIAKEHLEVIA